MLNNQSSTVGGYYSGFEELTDKKDCQLKQSWESREEVEDKNKTCLKLLETQSNLLKLWFLVVTWHPNLGRVVQALPYMPQQF